MASIKNKRPFGINTVSPWRSIPEALLGLVCHAPARLLGTVVVLSLAVFGLAACGQQSGATGAKPEDGANGSGAKANGKSSPSTGRSSTVGNFPGADKTEYQPSYCRRFTSAIAHLDPEIVYQPRVSYYLGGGPRFTAREKASAKKAVKLEAGGPPSPNPKLVGSFAEKTNGEYSCNFSRSMKAAGVLLWVANYTAPITEKEYRQVTGVALMPDVPKKDVPGLGDWAFEFEVPSGAEGPGTSTLATGVGNYVVRLTDVQSAVPVSLISGAAHGVVEMLR